MNESGKNDRNLDPVLTFSQDDFAPISLSAEANSKTQKKERKRLDLEPWGGAVVANHGPMLKSYVGPDSG